jgi:MFS family permease
MQAKLAWFNLGYFLFVFARSAITSYLPLSLLSFTHASLLAVGLSFAFPCIAQISTMFLFGAALDRGKSSRVYQGIVFVGYAALTVEYVLFYIMTLDSPNAVIYLVVLISCNMIGVGYIPAVRKFMSILATEATQGNAQATLGIFESVGLSTGALLGGVFFLAGTASLFALAMVTSGASLIILVLTRPFTLIDHLLLPGKSEPAPVRVRPEVRAPARDIKANIGISFSQLLAYLIILNVALGLFFPYFAPFVISAGGASILVGLSLAISCLAGTVVYRLLGRISDRAHPFFAMYYGVFGYLAVFLVFAFSRDPVVYAIAWALPVYPYFVGASYIVARVTPEKLRGRGFSLAAIAQVGGQAAGAVISALFADSVSYHDLVLAGIVVLLGGFLFLVSATAWQKIKARHAR